MPVWLFVFDPTVSPVSGPLDVFGFSSFVQVIVPAYLPPTFAFWTGLWPQSPQLPTLALATVVCELPVPIVFLFSQRFLVTGMPTGGHQRVSPNPAEKEQQ